MTKQDIDDIIRTICPNDEDFEKPIISPAYLKQELEALALEQEPCEDCVSQKSRWIPVSERLPEESGDYLIAIADNSYKYGQFFEVSWFYPSTNSWSYLNANVIAWMSLPGPYKAESEETDANSN